MLLRTSTTTAPWTVVEGNDKLWERVKSLDTVNELLEASLGPLPSPTPSSSKKSSQEEEEELNEPPLRGRLSPRGYQARGSLGQQKLLW